MARRYALYLLPAADSALWRFGSAVVGYDAVTGAAPAPLDLPGFDAARRRDITADPRRYGFHGTLKAPFRLAAGVQEADLTAAAERLAQERHGFELPPLAVAALGPFIALVPPVPVPMLDDLAACAVRDLDPLRAPLSPAEMARRRPDALSARQRAYLAAYGYPYVLDEFRFHMTLTGPLDAGEQLHALTALRDAFAASGACAPLFVADICLLVQEDAGEPFRLMGRMGLSRGG